MRRTLLFLPGNNPGNLQSGAVFGADGIILDLEDSVSPAEKDAARLLVASALKSVDYAGVERAVRINTPFAQISTRLGGACTVIAATILMRALQ